VTAPTTASTSRRWIGRIVSAALIVLAIAFVVNWGLARIPHPGRVRVQRQAVSDAALGPGDMRIYNRDSSVDVVLAGDKVLAGLSPKTVEKVRSEMEKSAARDTSGLGGMIAQTVKQTVASNIGIHAVYPLIEIADLRYDDGRLTIHKHDGSVTHLFGNAKVNDRDVSKSFPEEDAQRFIDAVRARKAALGLP
jgi:hypothetical protein